MDGYNAKKSVETQFKHNSSDCNKITNIKTSLLGYYSEQFSPLKWSAQTWGIDEYTNSTPLSKHESSQHLQTPSNLQYMKTIAESIKRRERTQRQASSFSKHNPANNKEQNNIIIFKSPISMSLEIKRISLLALGWIVGTAKRVCCFITVSSFAGFATPACSPRVTSLLAVVTWSILRSFGPLMDLEVMLSRISVWKL